MFNGKVHNLCAMAEKAQCHGPCLFSAGRGQMNSVQDARTRKTMWLLSDPVGFYDALNNDIVTFRRRQLRKGITPCVRLGGTDDKGDGIKLAPFHPDVQFYDYTRWSNVLMVNCRPIITSRCLTVKLTRNTQSKC